MALSHWKRIAVCALGLWLPTAVFAADGPVAPLALPAPAPAAPAPVVAAPDDKTSCEDAYQAVLQEVGAFHQGKYDDLVHNAQQSFTKAEQAHLKQLIPVFSRGVKATLAKVSDVIAAWNKHPFPTTAVTDTSVPKAYALVQDAYGELSPELRQLGNPASVSAEFSGMVQSAGQYKQQLSDLQVETANLQIKVNAIQDALNAAEKSGKASGYAFKAPVATSDGKGGITLESDPSKWQDFYYGSKTLMKQELASAKKELWHRTHYGIFGKNDIRNRDILQAATLQQLKNVQQIILQGIVGHPGKPVPPSLKTLLDSINALYAKTGRKAFKDSVQPPLWAWQSVHLSEINSEMKTWYSKTVPALKDKIDSNKWLKFIQKMPAQDKQILGISNVSNKIGWLAQTRWGVVLTQLTGGGSVALAGYNFFMSDPRKKETCEVMTGQSAFNSCLEEYLDSKYGYRIDLHGMEDNNYALDGKITNPKVIKTITEMVQRNNQYVMQSHSQKSQTATIGLYTGNIDYNSPAYLQALIKNPNNDQFTQALIGTGSGKQAQVPYLQFLDPDVFAAHQSELGQILSQPLASQAQGTLLKTLETHSPTLASDLEQILIQRAKQQNIPPKSNFLPKPNPDLYPSGNSSLPGFPSMFPSGKPSSKPSGKPSGDSGRLPIDFNGPGSVDP